MYSILPLLWEYGNYSCQDGERAVNAANSDWDQKIQKHLLGVHERDDRQAYIARLGYQHV